MRNEACLKWKSLMGQVKVLMSPMKRKMKRRGVQGARVRGAGPASFIGSHGCPHWLYSSGTFLFTEEDSSICTPSESSKTVMEEKPWAEGSGAGNSILGFFVGSYFPGSQIGELSGRAQPAPSFHLPRALTTPSSVRSTPSLSSSPVQ